MPAHSQWLGDAKDENLIHHGIELVYNLKFDSARAEFEQVVRSKPDHPAGHFFLAMVEWWTIVINPDDESHDQKFLHSIQNVIDVCDKRLDKNENDVAALFFKGGAVGFRGRLHATRGDWVKAANDGRTAMPIVDKAYEIAPKDYDVLLGMGIYNYYAAIIPDQYPVVKPLMIFFPKGDKMKGIEQLREASAKASYANYEAALFLVQLYQNYEKQAASALPFAEQLHKRFPDNPVFQKYLGRCYASLGQWENINRTFSEILDRVHAHETGYNDASEREAHYYLGLAEMQHEAYDNALQHFYRCDELSRTLDKKTSSGFMSQANLRMGMAYDKQFKRALAIEQYNKVLSMDDYQNAHKLAKQYLESPYVR